MTLSFLHLDIKFSTCYYIGNGSNGECDLAITIRDVAKKANVGIGTVSRVLNNSTSVRPETRKKILDAIDTLNFTPNVAARRLSMGITKSIAVVLSSLTIESTFERLKGIQIAIDQTEYDLVLYSPNTIQKRKKILAQLTNGGLTDGVLLISLNPTKEEIEIFKNSKTPLVLVETFLPEFSSIHINNHKGGLIATQHLIDLGHKNIGIMTDYLGDEQGFSPMRSRYEGYREALEKSNLTFNKKNHYLSPHTLHDAERIAKEWLVAENRPSAIFASSDIQAIGIIKASKILKIRIPQDLSIIGFDDIESAHLMDLTTIKQPLYESGVKALEIIIKLITQENQQPIMIELPVHLLNRKTTQSYQ